MALVEFPSFRNTPRPPARPLPPPPSTRPKPSKNTLDQPNTIKSLHAQLSPPAPKFGVHTTLHPLYLFPTNEVFQTPPTFLENVLLLVHRESCAPPPPPLPLPRLLPIEPSILPSPTYSRPNRPPSATFPQHARLPFSKSVARPFPHSVHTQSSRQAAATSSKTKHTLFHRKHGICFRTEQQSQARRYIP